jgi:hypothetical protein
LKLNIDPYGAFAAIAALGQIRKRRQDAGATSLAARVTGRREESQHHGIGDPTARLQGMLEANE